MSLWKDNERILQGLIRLFLNLRKLPVTFVYSFVIAC